MRRPRLKHLLGTIGVALGMLGLLNFLIARSARRMPPQQLLARIDATAQNARVVFLGDSQVDADIDPAAFSAACGLASMNVGLGGTKSSEHCLVLEHVLRHALGVGTVFYGFYDNLLTQPVPSDLREIGGNRALAFLFPQRAAELLFPHSARSRFEFRILSGIPLFTQRHTLWTKVERVRRTLAAVGMPPIARNRFGGVIDFAAMEPKDEITFRRDLAEAVRERRPFNFAVREMLRHCRERQLRFELILMPVQAARRMRWYSSVEWRDYCAYVTELVKSEGGALIDAADWIADDQFEDPLHAYPHGARSFSTLLAKATCPEKP